MAVYGPATKAYADGTMPKRGDTVVTVKYKEPSRLAKSPEDYAIWIVMNFCGDTLRAKNAQAPEWKQAFTISEMEPIATTR